MLANNEAVRRGKHVLGGWVAPVSNHLVDLGDKMGINARPNDTLHHSQVFQIFMSLKQRVASEEFDENASYAPYVTGVRPSETKDDLGGSIMPSRDHRRMVFVLKGGRSKIDKADLRIQENPSLTGVSVDRC